MAAEYLAASRVLEKVLKKQGTPKSLTINSNSNNKKKIFALVSETLKYKTVLDDIIEQTKLCASEKQLSYSLALVLVYDFLFGCGLQCGGGLKLAVTGHKASLQAALANMKAKAKVSKNEDLLPETIKHWQTVIIPRYVRVNRLKTTTDAVCQQFIKEGFLQVKFDMGKDSSTIPSQAFFVDPHIPDILVFSPGTDLHSHPLYTQGHIILQDKASCFPAHVLAPEHDSHVIDACAAPGNKTSHLASIINNTGRIFAFDLDQRRLNTMDKLMKKAGVKCAVLENKDFLKVDPSEYPLVTHILVDPSCSGSGIINRLDHLTQTPQTQSEDKKRIESLSKFQLSAVLHALSFPSVQRVVYSTCSIHQEENEDVVKAALEQRNQFQLKNILPTWTHRGLPSLPNGDFCVRASEKDNTNGFFVALFERKTFSQSSTDTAVKDMQTNKKRKRQRKRKRKGKESVLPDTENACLGIVGLPSVTLPQLSVKETNLVEETTETKSNLNEKPSNKSSKKRKRKKRKSLEIDKE